jgi:hypothetical protein
MSMQELHVSVKFTGALQRFGKGFFTQMFILGKILAKI